ncbi:MAG: hypothetical protein GX640_18800, partial [Fibrobacter sp.]|nr:hypothetical protein [Fibrobacter sp.]
TDLYGRSVRLSDNSGRSENHISDGVYFVYNKNNNQLYTGKKQAQLLSELQDTISISYQGTFIKKIPVSQLSGVLNISLDTDLPARKHYLLVSSYSNNAVYILSTDNKVEWEYKMPGSVQDAWVLENGNILLSGGSDVREVTRTKQVVWNYTASAGEIHNCYPLPGNVVLFGENSSGKLYEIDRTTNTILRTVQTPCKGDNHNRFRMVRKTDDSTYLITASGEGIIYELNNTGTVLRKIYGDTLKKNFGISYSAIHSAVKLENGNILIGCGYNSSFVEIDKQDNLIWKLSASDIPEIGFNYSAAGQILPGGTFVFATYTSTYKLVEVTRAKKVIWKLQNSSIGNPTHVYVMDCWSSKCDYNGADMLVR